MIVRLGYQNRLHLLYDGQLQCKVSRENFTFQSGYIINLRCDVGPVTQYQVTMISVTLIWAMTCNKFSHSRVVIDVLADDSDRPVGNMSAKILRITLTPVRLAGSVIATSMWEAILVFTDNFGAKVLTKVLCFVWEADSSWPTAAGNCRALQAWTPSCHVWPAFALPALSQLPNQEPPRPQHVSLPELAMVPHLGHTELVSAVVTVGVGITVWLMQVWLMQEEKAMKVTRL